MIKFDKIGPEKILQVYDPETGMKGFTVIDSTRLGPAKGGIRMTKDVTVEEVTKLARAMSLKNALADLPFGGGKSGIIADGKNLDPKKKDAFVSSFAKAIKPICPSQYVAAPDIYMAEHEMEVFAKANGSLKSCTGKPQNLCQGHSCGIPHELGSTGYGVYHATLAALKHMKKKLKGMTIAIDGFGNVGRFAARYLTEAGAKLVSVTDSKGGVCYPKGIDYKTLAKVKDEKGSITQFDQGDDMTPDELMVCDADILIPAAKPDLITLKNYKKVKAKLIVEGANIPITPEAEEKLHEAGVLVVPDFIANAGGVISSYIEFIGGKSNEVFPVVQKKITENVSLVLKRAVKENISPRAAGLQIAEERIFSSHRFNG